MDLKNLKAGKSTTPFFADLMVEAKITKIDGGYTITINDTTAGLQYDKDAKAWRLVHDQVAIDLDGETSKTVAEAATRMLVKLIEAATPAPEPEPEIVEVDEDKLEKITDRIAKLLAKANDAATTAEEAQIYLGKAAALMVKYGVDEEDTRRRLAKDSGKTAKDEKIVQFDMHIDTRGGHGMHRMIAIQSIVKAMGGDLFYTTGKGVGYNVETIFHIYAQESIIKQLKIFLPAASLAMETLAKAESRRVSHDARLRGQHHSLMGCRARRGFMVGFGEGVAERITANVEEIIKEDVGGSKALVLKDRSGQLATYMEQFGEMRQNNAQRHDAAARNRGREAGRAFASPKIDVDSKIAIEA